MTALRMPTAKRPLLRLASVQERELFAFGLYRVLEAALLLLLAFGSAGLVTVHEPALLQSAAALYFGSALLLLWLGHGTGVPLPAQAAMGLGVDIVAATLALGTQQGADGAIALLLVFNLAIAGLILDLRTSFSLALLAVGAMFGEHAFGTWRGDGSLRPLVETAMYAVCSLAGTAFAQFMRREIARSEALADARGTELARLAEINDVVIRRMRTGVLVLDGEHRIRQFNEAAWALLGVPIGDERSLATLAPALDAALRRWRDGRHDAPRSLRLQPDGPELLPRFVAAGLRDALFLVFLDDGRLYSNRAEELTLATLGRLSASIAHEVRNPLAAIQHAAQLLAETETLDAADRRLLEIILGQCRRMDGIVQNVLGLARRERSQAEVVDVAALVRRFVQDHHAVHPDSRPLLKESTREAAQGLMDPRHLQQVLTILVSNALSYGRLPDRAPDVLVRVSRDANGDALVDVVDHGPGIPPAVAEHLFEPFFTTSEHGTGLGLYIARQLCEANQAALNHVPMAGGGSCFRVRLASPRSLLADDPPKRIG
jgi:two-component system sensor histidine kinase PilS (NtrC family)